LNVTVQLAVFEALVAGSKSAPEFQRLHVLANLHFAIAHGLLEIPANHGGIIVGKANWVQAFVVLVADNQSERQWALLGSDGDMRTNTGDRCCAGSCGETGDP